MPRLHNDTVNGKRTSAYSLKNRRRPRNSDKSKNCPKSQRESVKGVRQNNGGAICTAMALLTQNTALGVIPAQKQEQKLPQANGSSQQLRQHGIAYVKFTCGNKHSALRHLQKALRKQTIGVGKSLEKVRPEEGRFHARRAHAESAGRAKARKALLSPSFLRPSSLPRGGGFHCA